MSLNLYVGDAVALAKLSYDLCNKGFKAARDAPRNFRELLIELQLIRKTLWRIQARITTGADNIDQDVREVLGICQAALEDFKPLVLKYEKLGKHFRQYWE